jgi:trehalose 6-phosphate phosphatase
LLLTVPDHLHIALDPSVPVQATRPPIRRGPPPELLRQCALFLDIDGTLLDLAPTPEHVLVDDDIARLLPALGRHLGGAVALITGRTIRDADALFPGLTLPVAGQHGLERRSADGVLHSHGEGPPGYGWLHGELEQLCARHSGLWLEDKGATLALHYRLAPGLASYVHRTVRAIVSTLGASGSQWRLQPGKGIIEIKPAGRDKGAAILDYMSEKPFVGRLPVFVGDDRTDEFGFNAVTVLGGWAVKVGPGITNARFRLRDVATVRQWLTGLLPRMRSAASAPARA